MKRWVQRGTLVLLVFGCGSESNDSDNSAGVEGGNETVESCFSTQECPDAQYCRATDPTASPEGSCVSLESAGGVCVFGTECAAGLACVKIVRSGSGVCEAFPESCQDSPTCMCALTLCEALEGSSCSAGDLDDPASSITVSCAESP